MHPLLCTKTTAVLLLSFAFKNQAVQSIACKAKGVAKQGVQRKGGCKVRGAKQRGGAKQGVQSIGGCKARGAKKGGGAK